MRKVFDTKKINTPKVKAIKTLQNQWFFGGRRFLVLIIKVTVTELSEASAPSMYYM